MYNLIQNLIAVIFLSCVETNLGPYFASFAQRKLPKFLTLTASTLIKPTSLTPSS